MENNEENLGSQEPVTETTTTSSAPKSLNIKPVAIIVAAVVILLVLFFMFFTRSAKSAVKDYVKAFAKADAEKVMNLMDYEGAAAFKACTTYSGETKFENFDAKYKEITDQIKNLDKAEKATYEEAKKTQVKSLQTTLDLFKSSDLKMSVKNVKTEKVDGSKKLTRVTATMKVKFAGQEAEQEVTFYTVKKGLKHYIVSAEDMM